MAGRFQTPNEQFLDENGDPLAAGELAFFESETTTPLDTYSDDGLTVPNTNPVILDGAGRAGDIFLTDADYKVTLSKADGTVVWTADPVRATSEKSTTVRTVSTTTELGAADDGRWIAADATAGGFVVTLPLASEAGNGYRVTIQKVDTGTNIVTVDGKNADRINGATTFDLTAEFAGATFQCDGSTWYALIPERTPLPRGYIDGFQIEVVSGQEATQRRMNPGKLRNASDTRNATLSTALLKKIDEPWAQGNNQGGLFTGSFAADASYHYIVIQNDATFDIDWGWDTDPSGVNAPNGWTAQRRVGSIKSFDDGGTPELPQMVQRGEYFFYTDIPSEVISGVGSSAAPTLHAITALPTGVELRAIGTVRISQSSGAIQVGVYDATVTNVDQDSAYQARLRAEGVPATVVTGHFEAWCDTQAQLGLTKSASNDSPRMSVFGWKDLRGTDSL